MHILIRKLLKDNRNGTGCIPCGYGMKFSGGECVCNNDTHILTELGCYDPSLIAGLGNLG